MCHDSWLCTHVVFTSKVQEFIHPGRNCPLGQDALLWRIGTRRLYAESKLVVVDLDGFCRFSLHVYDSMDSYLDSSWRSFRVILGFTGCCKKVIFRWAFTCDYSSGDSNCTTYAICKQAPGQARALCERSLLPKFNASEAESRHLRCLDKLPPNHNTVAEQDFAFQTLHGKCRTS